MQTHENKSNCLDELIHAFSIDWCPAMGLLHNMLFESLGDERLVSGTINLAYCSGAKVMVKHMKKVLARFPSKNSECCKCTLAKWIL